MKFLNNYKRQEEKHQFIKLLLDLGVTSGQ